MKKTFTIAALALAESFGAIASAQTPIAGQSTTVGVTVTSSTQVASGWSVKRTLLGKSIYNDAGQRVGKVEDLIIAPDRNVSYVILGAGGFVGIGQHAVAIPVTQIQNKSGKLVMVGATKEMIAALPKFDYMAPSSQADSKSIP